MMNRRAALSRTTQGAAAGPDLRLADEAKRMLTKLRRAEN